MSARMSTLVAMLMAVSLIACSDQALTVHEELPTPAATRAAETSEPFSPAANLATPLVDIPIVEYRPLFRGDDTAVAVRVAQFRLESHAVTNSQFLAFVHSNPKWRRSAVSKLFADANYLRHWPADLQLAPATEDHPVTQVSWFAARAYAGWIGRRLPSVAEWEAVAAASETQSYGREEPEFVQRILDWYARPHSKRAAAIGSTFPNVYGIYDMHGLIWEWVEDFNTALVTGESRGDTGLERSLFCGAGSISVADPTDYAAFMRYAFRSSLRADYAVRNLGFRCAAEARNP